jgi:hypothetical protein
MKAFAIALCILLSSCSALAPVAPPVPQETDAQKEVRCGLTAFGNALGQEALNNRLPPAGLEARLAKIEADSTINPVAKENVITSIRRGYYNGVPDVEPQNVHDILFLFCLNS